MLGSWWNCEGLSGACPPETEPQFPLKPPLFWRVLNPFVCSGSLAHCSILCHVSGGAAYLRLDPMEWVSHP